MKPILLLFLAAFTAAAADTWPQWRSDANRSGATDHELPAALHLAWTRDLGAPDPAFYHQIRICADVTYAPVAAEGLLFVPSNRTDSVTAYDLAGGAERWRYIAGAPVRFAPVYADGKLCFGADDGYVYCLTAATGKLLWRTRPAPAKLPDSWLLVNNRLSSRWAVRGAPVVRGDTVYVGCGVWPEEGAYVAAIDLATGKIRWRNDAVSLVPDGMNDHGKAYQIALPPHGYPAIIDGRLLISSGRSPAAFLDLDTGKMEPYTTMYAKFNAPRGAWYVSGIGRYWFQGGNLLGTRAEALGKLPPDRMTIEEFARMTGVPLAELQQLKRSHTKKTAKAPKGKKKGKKAKKSKEHGVSTIAFTEEGGKTYVEYKFSDPFQAGMSRPRTILPNEAYFLKNRPLLRVDPVHQADMHADTGVFSEPVWTPTTLYWSEFSDPRRHVVHRGLTEVQFPTYDWIVARDLTRPGWTVTRPRLFREKVFPVKWKLKAPYKVLAKAGSRLYCAGNGAIAAVQIPRAGGKPAVAWTAKVDGVPVNIAIAQGRLAVVTNTGRLYVYGGAATRAVTFRKPAVPAVDGTWRKVAIAASAARQSPGYAIVLGWNSGRLATAFSADWNTIVIEPDQANVRAARNQLAAAGICGKRIQVIHGSPATLDIAPLWADAIVSEDLSGVTGDIPAFVTKTLRPFSGTAILPGAVTIHAGNDFRLDTVDGMTRVRRIAPPPGSADWTHEAANAANTYTTNDANVKAPLQLLWLGGDLDRRGRAEFEFQHSRSPFPLYWHGRIIYLAGRFVHAGDIYTGRWLWTFELPKTKKTEMLAWNHRPFSREIDDNYLILDGRLYIVSGNACIVVDAATGSKLTTFALGNLRELRGAHGRLYATADNTLTCLDARTGQVVWKRRGPRKDIAFAIGGGKLFGIDYDAPPKLGGVTKPAGATLFALDLATGRKQWTKPLSIPPLPKYDIVGVSKAEETVGPVKPLLAYNAKHDLLVSILNRTNIAVHRAATGADLWRKHFPWAPVQVLRFEPPAILDDYLLPHQRDYARSGGIFDIRTGNPVDLGNIVPSKRSCARIVGNNNLVTYRDAATAIYDLQHRKLLRNNAIRSGCTNGMIPAGGILNAPNFANGCVCNYPIFASYALFHNPNIATILRPAP